MAYDKIIIGAGLYGLYSALFCGKQGDEVLVLECEDAPFKRATYINQARVHMGYHYPRSISTAIKSRGYFHRFNKDYGFCVHSKFDKVYATSKNFSWTNAEQFRKFCKDSNIHCDDIAPSKYFKDGMCDGAFLTTEYTYDAEILKEWLLKELENYPNIKVRYSSNIESIVKKDNLFEIMLKTGEKLESGFVLNSTYASVNQIHQLLGYEPFKIKYEICEIILCKVNEELKNTGITVMDGPFFSIMPFGKTGYHSLTSVTFTPHITSYDSVPTFDCQKRSGGFCSPENLGNCNDCPAKPESAWPYMSNITKKYMKDKFEFEYVGSLFSMKPILKASEIDDSRPTVIKQYSSNPTFISVLSGKINTVYDLDEVLRNGK
ncbi:FAD-dependent oxidoreductase [Clostridium tunisiense]|uniref:FAD-dependent oxidoreductase n=1 Tax=Clostridium tunisiense TaxID=219748 RepID=UPI00031A0721|nr:FAD-dependent oxidoreductase [Clostridium tunisiense]